MAGPYNLQNDPSQVALEAGFGFLGPLWAESSLSGYTALASGGQAGATLMQMMVNNITTVANVGDSVRLPPAVPGLQICLVNAAVKSMQVYGTGSDTINGVASGTGVSQQGSSAVFYVCTVAGTWIANPADQADALAGLVAKTSGDDHLAEAPVPDVLHGLLEAH